MTTGRSLRRVSKTILSINFIDIHEGIINVMGSNISQTVSNSDQYQSIAHSIWLKFNRLIWKSRGHVGRWTSPTKNKYYRSVSFYRSILSSHQKNKHYRSVNQHRTVDYRAPLFTRWNTSQDKSHGRHGVKEGHRIEGCFCPPSPPNRKASEEAKPQVGCSMVQRRSQWCIWSTRGCSP